MDGKVGGGGENEGGANMVMRWMQAASMIVGGHGGHGGVVEYGRMTQSSTGLARGRWGKVEEKGGEESKQDKKHVKRKRKKNHDILVRH
jgi:hypothetical protein